MQSTVNVTDLSFCTVMLSNPDFPGDASNGIQLTVDSSIPSQSNLGFELGTVNFIASYKGSVIGPVSGDDLTLAPLTTTQLPLEGVITYRDDAAGLAALGEVFSLFLMGENVPLDVMGDSVISPAQRAPVSWLSAAFKTLTISNVTLPGKRSDIISAVRNSRSCRVPCAGLTVLHSSRRFRLQT